MNDFEKISLLGVDFTNATEAEILEFIYTGLQENIKKYYIVTPNPELLVIASKDKQYKNILNGAKLALVDGIGVMIAARFMGKHLKQRITGVDFVESLCGYISNRPITVSFLGGGPGVAEKASECLKKKYTGLKVSWVSTEWNDLLVDKKTDILLVAFGSPKQERWIYENFDKLPSKITIGVGGAFDFISGNVPRAPKKIRSLGFEWAYRLIVQPWRIKRQFSLIKFVFLVMREKFINSSKS